MFRRYAYKASKNDSQTLWILKCDIRKFFASINQVVLMSIVARRVADRNTIWLVGNVVGSFSSTAQGKGLPLGNLTSQLLVNIYMNEFDQFVKHKLKVKHYIRYADDFVFFSLDHRVLLTLLARARFFLQENLRLELHPTKVSIETLASGVDFLGWVHFFDHRVLRTSTKRRMLKVLQGGSSEETVSAYRGMLKHGNAYKLSRLIPPPKPK